MPPIILALLATFGLCIITVAGDLFLKWASDTPHPYKSIWFLLGFIVYSSTCFGWVFVMKHLRFASFGAAYSVASVLLLAGIGWSVLGESMKWQELVGIGMAIGAVVLLARFGG